MTEQRKTVTDELNTALGALSVAHKHVAPIGPGLTEPIDAAVAAIERAIKAIQHVRCDAQAALDRF